MAPGRQRKGDRWCRNKHKVQRREKRKEAEMLKCRFKQKEIWSSSKSLTPCTEGPEMHMKGLCSCPIYSRYRTAVRWSTQQVRCPFFFFLYFFLTFFCHWKVTIYWQAVNKLRTWANPLLPTCEGLDLKTHSILFKTTRQLLIQEINCVTKM